MTNRELIYRLTRELYDLKALQEELVKLSDIAYNGFKKDIKLSKNNEYVLHAIIDLSNLLCEVHVYED